MGRKKKEPLQSFPENGTIDNLSFFGNNFRYYSGVRVETRTVQEDENKEFESGSYPRIEVCDIAVDMNEMVRTVLRFINNCYFLSEFEEYCIERLCHIHGLWDGKKFEGKIDGGYYGPEVGEVIFGKEKYVYKGEKYWQDESHSYSQMISPEFIEFKENVVKVLKAKTNREKLFVTLMEEYGHIHKEISNLNDFEFGTMKTEYLLIDGEPLYFKKKDILPVYENFKGIIGVIVVGCKVVDGKQRALAAKYSGQKEVKVIFAR
jgi:hypothetical protein